MEKLLYEKKKSRTKWWTLWVILVICVLVVGALGAAFCYFYYFATRDGRGAPSELVLLPKESCLSKDCLEATVQILSSLDDSANPCEDFYQFTCGNFIPEGHRRINLGKFRAESGKNKNMFISSPIRGDEPTNLLLQKKFFQSCMNLEAIDEDDGETFLELLEGIGGWPIVKAQDWDEDKITLEDFLVQCNNLGLPFQWLFEIKYYGNWGSLLIYPPKMQYNELFFEHTYKKLIVDIAVELGASKSLAEREVNRMGKFARELQNIIFRNNQSDLIIMDEYEIHNAFPRFSWPDFLNNITAGANYSIAENDTVIGVDTYLQDLNLLLATTPKSVQINYMVWKIIVYFNHYLPRQLREKFENTPTSPAIPTNPTTRFQFCIEDAKNRVPFIQEQEFIRWYIDEDKSENILNMITYIKDQFLLRLQSEEWFDDDSKIAAIADLDHIIEILGKRKLELNEEVLEYFLYTDNLEFTSDNIITMITEKNIYDFNRHVSLADVMDNLDVDILKAIDSVMAVVPDNIYSNERPNYLNYATLGSNRGRKIAEQLIGNALYPDFVEPENYLPWLGEGIEETQNETSSNDTKTWSNDSISALLKGAQCIVDSDDILKPEIIDDEETLVLLAAESIGVSIAYDAYVKWVEEHGPELKLISLPFTPQQLFWIQYGTINCVNRADTEYSHANLRYRLLSSLRYSKNFAKDFDCPLGTIMNPISKCHVF